ncbi:MAG: oxidoreductase [Spirochaetaceae bacterium]|nr:oxidoreductase [Spirochaetaceae bacterium]|tara:strand:- start:62873 stop:64003 length:1131 start_codon:yes stop_codon:yes gene_type:complete
MKKKSVAKKSRSARNPGKSSAGGGRSGTKTGKGILVTGALGFIGSNVALALAKKGRVIGLDMINPNELGPDHPLQKRFNQLKRAGIEYIQGELTDSGLPQRLESVLANCHALVHTAAPVKEKGPLEQFRAVNVEATLRLAQTARNQGVKRWVQLSSVMVYGFNYPPHVSEEGPLRGDDNPYCITKIESEHALLGLSDVRSMDVVILRPGDVYGPASVPWVVRPLEMMRKKQFLLLDGGRYTINHVHISHIVQAIELALKSSGGQIFNVTDGISSTCGEYFGALAAMAGYAPPPSIPSWAARMGALIMEGGSALIGREAQLNREALKFVMRPHPVSSRKATELLGYRPKVSLTEGLEEIRSWLHEERPDLLAPGLTK